MNKGSENKRCQKKNNKVSGKKNNSETPERVIQTIYNCRVWKSSNINIQGKVIIYSRYFAGAKLRLVERVSRNDISR